MVVGFVSAQWRALGDATGLRAFAAAAFDDVRKRFAHDGEIDSALAAWCAGRDPWEAVETLTAAGVPAAVVARPSDLYSDPQLAHRGFFVTCEHGVMGLTPYDGPATIFSATPAQLTAAPCLGEHTDYVLRDLLGLTDDEIAEYAAAGVFS